MGLKLGLEAWGSETSKRNRLEQPAITELREYPKGMVSTFCGIEDIQEHQSDYPQKENRS